MTPIHEFLSHLERVREHEDEWTACCPAHDDRSPSLSITEGDTHPIIVHCFAGCTMDEIAHAVGMSPAQFFEEDDVRDKVRRNTQATPRPSVQYSDEEWERRCRLWKQMDEIELELLEYSRRQKYRAKEDRNSERFYFWEGRLEWLYDELERTQTCT